MYVRDHVVMWSCTYMIIYVLGRFRVQAGCVTTALTYTQSAPQPLLHMLSERLSSFCACSVSASAAYAHAQQAPQRLLHAQCAPQQFPRTLRVRQRFWKFQGTASAYTEYAPKPLYCMLRGRRSCFSILSESASAASAHAQSAPKLCNSPNSGRIKKPFF